MANANRPSGLSPVGNIGGPFTGQVRLYSILAANTNAFAIGDPVVTDAGGGDTRGIPAVTLAAATGAIRGVVVGVFDTYPGIKINNQSSLIRPAAAQTGVWYVLVCDDPDTVFEVQEIGTGTPLAVADIGLNTNLVVGTNNGFVSGWLLDNATEAATSTLQCRILGLVQRVDVELGAYAKWLVKINNHELAGGTSGV